MEDELETLQCNFVAESFDAASQRVEGFGLSAFDLQLKHFTKLAPEEAMLGAGI